MSFSSKIALSAIILHLICLSIALPISRQDKLQSLEYEWKHQIFSLFIGISSLLCLVGLVALCACCKKTESLKLNSISADVEQRTRSRLNCNNSRSVSNSNSEIPLSGISSSYSNSTSSQIYFEPLPDINTLQRGDLHPPISSTNADCKFSEKWFAEPFKNFPRNQLQYVRKMGSGWFGHVIEGRAAGIHTDHTSTVTPTSPFSKSAKHSMPVVVKSLREDATVQEQSYFLQELLPFRDLDHPNILKLLAYCIETQPFLILFQLCSKGTLKGVLKQGALNDDLLLKMCKDVSCGLIHMHQHNHIHVDLAARNCLVESDFTVKIGDYGCSVQLYPGDYYLAENVALPLRWCAPETLLCTENTIEMMQLTKSANIWSLAVLFWEMFSCAELPYKQYNEDEVIQKVILEKSIILEFLSLHNQLYYEKMKNISDMCWKPPDERPNVSHVHSLICEILLNKSDTNDKESGNFEHRWNQSNEPHKVVNTHNLCITDPAELRFESNFISGGLDDSFGNEKVMCTSNESLDAKVAATFGSSFPSWFGLESGQTMDSLTEEITDAINKLDEALADEMSPHLSTASSLEQRKATAGFVLGKDCSVSNPPTPLHNIIYGGESHRSRTLSDGEEELLTQRLEQGDFSELVRIKSQSVQDFMRLTVVDEGSDSDKTSQPGSIDANQALASDKCSSSESNLKEAIRDDGFMIELERLQSEHKFSIISEVSREGNPSLDYLSLVEDSLVYNAVSGDKNEQDDSCSEATTTTVTPEKVNDDTIESQHIVVSPDCIVSSRNKGSSALPDILVHYNRNLESKRSSTSSIDVKGNDNHDALLNDDSSIKNNSSKSDESPDAEVKVGSLVSPKLDTENILSSNEVQQSDLKFSPMEIQTIPESDSPFTPETLVEGEEVVIGALDYFSLEPFKSTNLFGFSSFGKENSSSPSSSSLSETETHPVSILRTAENFKESKNEYSLKENAENMVSAENKELQSGNIVHDINLYSEQKFDHIPSNEEISCNDVSDHFCNLKDDQTIHNIEETPVLNDGFADNTISLLSESSNEIDVAGNISSKVIINNMQRENQESLFNDDSMKISLNEQMNVSGEFWEQQMTAWQEAAHETRELLHKASHPNLVEKGVSLSDSPESEDELELAKSPITPISDGGSSKSAYSSTDKLYLEDEDTYISYDDAGDDDAFRYSPCDISNLRMELKLKLGNQGEIPSAMEEEPQENIIINYRSSIPLSLSPIKEESLLSDFEVVDPQICESNNSLNTNDNSSVEFVEIEADSSADPIAVDIPELDIASSAFDGEFTHLSIEEARNSLIFEDLENTEETVPKIVGLISDQEDVEDDLLIVDTETNEATLLNSDRPQSHLAFLNTCNNTEQFVIPSPNLLDDSDDVAQNSLPYEENNDNKIASTDGKPLENLNISSITKVYDNVEKPSAEPHHYHPYFTSALNSLTHPLPSLEDTSIYESEEHISLPYDVNYSDEQRNSLLQEAVASEAKREALFLEGSERNNSIIGKSIKVSNPDSSNYVTLSFLGKLYSEPPSECHEDGNGKEEKRSNEMTEEDIIEELPGDSAAVSGGTNEETPVRTPSQLGDFVWSEEHPPEMPQEPCYTPDWESDGESDPEGIEEDMESSSTSGEFIWQSGDGAEVPSKCQPTVESELLPEHQSSSYQDEAHYHDFGEESESGEEEFTPSTWNRELTPQRSLLKSPEKNLLSKKNVHWKKQKHHRVYEYPPEPQSWHSESSNQNARRTWGNHSLDYLTLADFEIGENFLDDSSDADEVLYPKISGSSIFELSPLSFKDSTTDGMFADDCEFYIRSSGAPFAFQRSSFSASEFFPNASTDFDYLLTDHQESSSADEETLLKDSQQLYLQGPQLNEGQDDGCNLDKSKEEEADAELQQERFSATEDSSSLGEFNHVKDKLRLDIPSLSLEGDEVNKPSSHAADDDNTIEKTLPEFT